MKLTVGKDTLVALTCMSIIRSKRGILIVALYKVAPGLSKLQSGKVVEEVGGPGGWVTLKYLDHRQHGLKYNKRGTRG